MIMRLTTLPAETLTEPVPDTRAPSAKKEVVMADKREGVVVEQGAEDRIERAGQLAREAMGYWQTTLRGLWAIPNATTLSVSSAVLYATGTAERAYQRVASLTGRIGADITREIGETRRAVPLTEPERAKRQPSA
jgi:hypothetical protein